MANRNYPQHPREGADNTGGYERDTGFSREHGYGHIPGQRWGGGLNANVSKFEPEGRQARPHEGPGHGYRGTDMGLGERAPAERGPHYGKGPKGYQRSDARTLEDLCEAIADQGFIDATNVEVLVKDGVATLRGTVAHRPDKKALEALAETIRGVDEVQNELRIPRPDVLRRSASRSDD